MRWLRHFEQAPLTLRVPLAVAALMIFISGLISERVLDRLSKSQESYLQSLASSYLDGITAAITPSVLRSDSWEIFDAIERMRPSGSTISTVETVVSDIDGNVLAASRPEERPTFGPVPTEFAARFSGSSIAIDADSGFGYIKRDMDYQSQRIGTVFAVFDVTSLMAERRLVLTTLLLTNGSITLLLAFIGFLAVRRMILPMRTLEMHMIDAASGASTEIPEAEFPKTGKESARLLKAYNRLVRASMERQDLSAKLAEEEKLASLGRLASGMAHEINNPLGGMMNVVDTLRKHGDKRGVRENSIELLQRGLEGIREVVQAALANYRPERMRRPFAAQDLADLRLLIKPELRRRSQTLRLEASDDVLSRFKLPAGPLRQATLNLLLNAVAVTPMSGEVTMRIHAEKDQLSVSVGDQGEGIPLAAKQVLTGSAEGETPLDGSGLGLWIVARICDELGARIIVEETKRGSTISMHFAMIDREEKIAA